jgi:D-beta-D-heptose 7-phosphate kinase/D-beta-D-heptose 1-phosphate adenosyltransferase
MVNILVVGEICEDIFIYCDVNRICPEAPVPILKPIEVVKNSGMSGNVVSNLKSLSNNLIITHLCQDEVITKTRYVEKKSNHMFIRVDEGEENLTQLNVDDIIDLEEFDIVVVSDYDKGFLTNEMITSIGRNSKLSILDSKRKLTNEIIESFTFVKLNESEYNQNNSLVKNNIIITLGSKGTQHNDIIYPSPNPQETIDVSGAGDTFTSSFILKYFETKNIYQSIEFANKMSSIVVSKRGVTTPNS